MAFHSSSFTISPKLFPKGPISVVISRWKTLEVCSDDLLISIISKWKKPQWNTQWQTQTVEGPHVGILYGPLVIQYLIIEQPLTVCLSNNQSVILSHKMH